MEDIVIRNLCKSFAGKPVLRDFSAVLPVGQVTGLMAPSGAGKTTLLRILMGLERPDGGTIDGLAGLRLSAVFQEDRLCDNLDPSANIRLINPTLGRRETEDALAAVGLAGCLRQPAGNSPAECAAGWRSCGHCWRNTTCSSWMSRSRVWTGRPKKP